MGARGVTGAKGVKGPCGLPCKHEYCAGWNACHHGNVELREREKARDRDSDLDAIKVLLEEQKAGTIERADQDSKGISMTFVARGEFLGLFVSRNKKHPLGGPLDRSYICRILEVKDGGFRGTEGKAG